MSEEPKLAKLLLVMPATREQTFSAIKHIIILLKNTRTRNELNHCFMFYVNYEKSDQPYMVHVAEDFIRGTAQKIKFPLRISSAALISSSCKGFQIFTPKTWNLNNFTVLMIVLGSIEGFWYFIHKFELVRFMSCKSLQLRCWNLFFLIYTLFYKSRFLFSSALMLLNFLMNWTSNVP